MHRPLFLAHRLCAGLSLLALLALSGGAQAGLFPTYPLGTTAGTWEVDRYAPAGFTNAGTVDGRTDALALSLVAADGQGSRPLAYSSTFYNTQGRGMRHDTPAYGVIYGSLYLPAAWATTNAGNATQNRRSGLWGVLSPAMGGDICAQSNCNLFPDLEFTNASPSDPLNAGGTGRFRAFDPNVGNVDLATPVAYDQWADLCMAYTGSEVRFYVNGALVYTQFPLDQADTSYGPVTHWARSIVQGYNFGSDYTVNWAGLGAGTLTTTAVSGGDNQATAPGAAFAAPLAVIARDAGGAPLPCVPVTFAAPAAGASAALSAVTVVTDRNGVASVTATANGTAGSYIVTATAPGLAATEFHLANVVLPTTIAVAAGNAQTAPVTTAYAMPLTALVTGAGAAPVAGVSVTFTLPATGASGTFPGGVLVANATTDANGLAISPVITANAIAGSFAPAAAVAGVATPAPFSLTNTIQNALLTKGFAPSTIPAGGTATLNLILGNPNPVPLTLTQAFTDPLPAGMTAAGGNTGTCAGVVVTTTLVTMPAGATVPSGGCTIAVSVLSLTPGALVNATSALVTSGGTAPAASATLTVSALALALDGGSGQTTVVSTTFDQPLEARVTSMGLPVAGVAVTFTLPGAGASGTFAGGGTSVTVLTDASGVATSPMVTANAIAGPFTATATIAGVPAVTFSLVNQPQAAPPAPAAPVPTLGAGALWLLTLLVALAAGLARRRPGA